MFPGSTFSWGTNYGFQSQFGRNFPFTDKRTRYVHRLVSLSRQIIITRIASVSTRTNHEMSLGAFLNFCLSYPGNYRVPSCRMRRWLTRVMVITVYVTQLTQSDSTQRLVLSLMSQAGQNISTLIGILWKQFLLAACNFIPRGRQAYW